MAGRIVIDIERCKGCGLCVAVCPKKGIVTSKISNKNGYFPAQKTDAECTGCAMCAIICPEAIIKVSRQANRIQETEVRSQKTGNKRKKRTVDKVQRSGDSVQFHKV